MYGATTLKSYDVAFTQNRSGAQGRFRHLTYFIDSREDVLQAADVFVEKARSSRPALISI
jgi:hypothetical protein